VVRGHRDRLAKPQVQSAQGLRAERDLARHGGRAASQQREVPSAGLLVEADRGHHLAADRERAVVACR